MFHDSILRLVYCGNFAFKEISAEFADELSPKSDHDSGNESGNESGDEDLQGTGLLETENDTDSDHKEAAANEHSQNKQSIEKQTQDHGDQQTQDHGNQQTQDSENVDVKPPLLAKFRFAHDTIEISSDSDNGDVPDQEENKLESDNDDCILDRVVPPKFDRITRERNYGCYVCLQTFKMQQSFVIHFQNQHPELPFRCEFCSLISSHQMDFLSTNVHMNT